MSVPALPRSTYGVPELDATARVEAGGGLVEEEKPGRPDKAGAQIEPTPHAARVRLHVPVADPGEVHQLENAGRIHSGHPPALAVEAGHHGQVLPPCHHLFHRGRLSGQADQSTDGHGLAHDVMAVHAERSAVGAQQGGHHADERGFPRAVGAEEGHHLSGWNGQVERVERLHLPESLAEALGLNEGVHARAPFMVSFVELNRRSRIRCGCCPSVGPSWVDLVVGRIRGRVTQHAAPVR